MSCLANNLAKLAIQVHLDRARGKYGDGDLLLANAIEMITQGLQERGGDCLCMAVVRVLSRFKKEKAQVIVFLLRECPTNLLSSISVHHLTKNGVSKWRDTIRSDVSQESPLEKHTKARRKAV